MICHERKIIFIHIPKNAGSSVEDMLWPKNKYQRTEDRLWMGFVKKFYNKYQTGGLQHLLALQILEEVGSEIFSEYFKFTVVRNPWDKCISQFLYIKTRKDLQEFISLPEDFSLPQYLDAIERKLHVQWQKQCEFIEDHQGRNLVDWVGRFENLENDMKCIAEIAGLDLSLEFPRSNSAQNRLHYSHYFDQESKERVAAMYAKDISKFGYSYEDKNESFGENYSEPSAQDASKYVVNIKYLRRRVSVGLKNKKVFFIGFNRCGTASFMELFEEIGVGTVHWDQNRLCLALKELNAGYKQILDDVYPGSSVFSDMINVPAHGLRNPNELIEGNKYFEDLADVYENAYFILNTRNIDNWVSSRMKYGGGDFARQYMKHLRYLFPNREVTKDYVAEYWKELWVNHHKNVELFFAKNSEMNFLKFNIETDPFVVFKNFLADDYEIKGEYFRRRCAWNEKDRPFVWD